MLALRANAERGFTCAIGIGGIGAGIMYSLHGEHDLGRNESRLGELLDSRDYCKLHIIEHYIARLWALEKARAPFAYCQSELSATMRLELRIWAK
jgi:hypothetical protein